MNGKMKEKKATKRPLKQEGREESGGGKIGIRTRRKNRKQKGGDSKQKKRSLAVI